MKVHKSRDARQPGVFPLTVEMFDILALPAPMGGSYAFWSPCLGHQLFQSNYMELMLVG